MIFRNENEWCAGINNIYGANIDIMGERQKAGDTLGDKYCINIEYIYTAKKPQRYSYSIYNQSQLSYWAGVHRCKFMDFKWSQEI